MRIAGGALRRGKPNRRVSGERYENALAPKLLRIVINFMLEQKLSEEVNFIFILL